MSNTNIIMAAAGATSPFVPGQLNWVYQDGLSQSQTIFGRVSVNQIVYTGSFYCAISSTGKVATSSDATTWTYQTGLLTTGFVQVQNIEAHWYAAGGFICLVCDDGRYYTSPDGVTWTQRTSLPLSPFTQIKAFISKSTTLCLFFNNGGLGSLYTSTDGITWTNQTSPSDLIQCGVANSSIFCIGGSTGIIFTSTDGITWTQRTQLTSTSWGFAQVNHIVWNGTYFCISRSDSSIAYSSDGITWSFVLVTNQGSSVGLVAAPTGDVRNILSTNNVYKSSTLTSWTLSTSLATNPNWQTTVYGSDSGGGIHVIGGDLGQIMTSSYASSAWVYRDDLSKSSTIFGQTSVDAIASNANQFVVASITNLRSATSPNGSTWTYQTGLNSALPAATVSEKVSIAWNGSVYCFVGGDSCATSSDGITWTAQTVPSPPASFYDIVWNGTIFCAVGDVDYCITSPDGVTWTYQSGLASSGWTATEAYAFRLTWNGSTFCLLGDYPYTATSPDGITWTLSTSLYNTSFGPSGLDDFGTGIAYGNGTFVAVGSAGACATSTDGITWVYQPQLSTFGEGSVYTLIWANGIFCLGGDQARTCLSSLDGITWVTEPNFPTPATIYGISYNGSKLCAGGLNGFIATTV